MSDTHALVAAQKRYVASGATRSLQGRREPLKALVAAMDKSERLLLEALCEDLGKSSSEAFVSELQGVKAECAYLFKNLERWMKPERRPVPLLARPGKAWVHREPCGSVLIIAPWNYPVHLSLTPLAGAMAAGCSMVLKPSERAPTVAQVLEQMLTDAFPKEQVAVVRGDATTGAQLAKQPFDHFFFTGSRQIGLKVAEAAAVHGVPVTLELGGKCPVVVFSNGDEGREKLRRRMATIARRIAWGKYLNAGQTCVAPDYVLVEKELYEPLLVELAKALKKFRKKDYGKLVDQQHFEQVRRYLGEGTIASGGGVDEADRRIETTLLVDLDVNSEVMREEIFGPILPVIACDTLEQAILKMNAHPDPLAVYAFTADQEVVERVRINTRSGALCVNDVVVHVASVDLPFGGTGSSGMGRYRGKASFDLFTRERVVLQRGLWPDFPFRYPPLPHLRFLKWFSRF